MKNSSLAFGSTLAVVSLLGTFSLAHAQDQPTPERPIAGTGDGFVGLRPNYPNGQRGYIWYGDEESRRRDQSGESLMFSARRQTGGPRPVEPDGQMYAVWAKDANGSEQYVGTFSDRAQALKAFDQANLDIDKRAFVTPITKGDEYYERLKHSWVEVPAYDKPNTTVAAGAPRPVHQDVKPSQNKQSSTKIETKGFTYKKDAPKQPESLLGTTWSHNHKGSELYTSVQYKFLEDGKVEFLYKGPNAQVLAGGNTTWTQNDSTVVIRHQWSEENISDEETGTIEGDLIRLRGKSLKSGNTWNYELVKEK